MKIKQLSCQVALDNYLKKLDVDKVGKKILTKKATLYYIQIQQLHVGGANILKQDALSVGADVAVPKGTIIAATSYVDVLIIASLRTLEKLAKKLLLQPFGLKEVGMYLQKITLTKKTPKIMGIINANDDSFYSGSRFKGKDAVKKIEKMIEDGADIIDIGGVSSRPGSKPISANEELKRVQDIIQTIEQQKLYEKIPFSIDSYSPEVIEFALDHGFSIVNDITGLQNDQVAQLCGKYHATAIIMHMQGTPQTMQLDPYYEDVTQEVFEFFQQQIQKAQHFGVEDIILDVGIGFGKTLQHNLTLLKELRSFEILQYPLLVGASRKSLIDKITPSDVQDRLGGTLAIHLKAYEEGAEYLRVHDVYEHKQAFMIYKEIYG